MMNALISYQIHAGDRANVPAVVHRPVHLNLLASKVAAVCKALPVCVALSMKGYSSRLLFNLSTQ